MGGLGAFWAASCHHYEQPPPRTYVNEKSPLLCFRAPGAEKCHPYSIFGPAFFFLEKRFVEKSPGSRLRPPTGRPADRPTARPFFFWENSFSKKVPARTVKRGGSLQTPPQPRLERRFGHPRFFFFDKKFFEQKSWLAPPSPGRPTDRPTDAPSQFFLEKKFFEKRSG